MKRASQYTLIALLFGLVLVSCMDAEGRKTLTPLQQLASETPVYPKLNQTNSNHIVKQGRAVLAFYYHSTASYDEVRGFYIKELTAKGWSIGEERAYGSDQEGMSFQKGEYVISVYHDPTPSDSGWDFAIDYSWRS